MARAPKHHRAEEAAATAVPNVVFSILLSLGELPPNRKAMRPRTMAVTSIESSSIISDTNTPIVQEQSLAIKREPYK